MKPVGSDKIGRWIRKYDVSEYRDVTFCSECGENIPCVVVSKSYARLYPVVEEIDPTNFCPNCGAMMNKDIEHEL